IVTPSKARNTAIDDQQNTRDRGQTMAMSRDEIFKKVQTVLLDALGVDEEEVTPTAVIRDDLGAESIDFLDIMFRLEKEFGIKIPRGEMIPENLANDPNIVKDGVITPAGIPILKSKMPRSH